MWLDPVLHGAGVRSRCATPARTIRIPRARTRSPRSCARFDASFTAGLQHCARRTIVTAHEPSAISPARYDLTQEPSPASIPSRSRAPTASRNWRISSGAST